MKENQQPQQAHIHGKHTGDIVPTRQHPGGQQRSKRQAWGQQIPRKGLLYLFALCSALLLFSAIGIYTDINITQAKAANVTANNIQSKKTIPPPPTSTLPLPFPTPTDTPTPIPTNTPTPIATNTPTPIPTAPPPTTPPPTPIPITSPTPTPCVFYILCITPTAVVGPTPTPIPVITPTPAPAPGVTPTTAPSNGGTNSGPNNGPTSTHPTPTPRPTTTTSQTLGGGGTGGTGGTGGGLFGGGGNTSSGATGNAANGKTGSTSLLTLIIIFIIALVVIACIALVYLGYRYYKQYQQRSKGGMLPPPTTAAPASQSQSTPGWTPYNNLQGGSMAGIADMANNASMSGAVPGGPFSMNGMQGMPNSQYGNYDAPTMAVNMNMQSNYTEPVPTEAMITPAPSIEQAQTIEQAQMDFATTPNTDIAGHNLTDPLMEAIIRQTQMGLFFLQGKDAEARTDLGD